MIRSASLLLAALLALALPVSAQAARRHHHHRHGHHARHSARHHHHHRRHHKRHRRHRRHARRPRRGAPAVASGSCAGADLRPTPQNLAEVQASTICLINSERIRHGERPLIPNGHLTKAAENHCHDMVARGYFSHISPGGQTPLGRIRASGFFPKGAFSFQIGENIAWGTGSLSTPQSIVQAWMESTAHRANILDPGYRYTGIGVAAAVPGSLGEGEPGAVYTQDFAAISG